MLSLCRGFPQRLHIHMYPLCVWTPDAKVHSARRAAGALRRCSAGRAGGRRPAAALWRAGGGCALPGWNLELVGRATVRLTSIGRPFSVSEIVSLF